MPEYFLQHLPEIQVVLLEYYLLFARKWQFVMRNPSPPIDPASYAYDSRPTLFFARSLFYRPSIRLQKCTLSDPNECYSCITKSPLNHTRKPDRNDYKHIMSVYIIFYGFYDFRIIAHSTLEIAANELYLKQKNNSRFHMSFALLHKSSVSQTI